MPLSHFDPDNYDRQLQDKVERLDTLLAPFVEDGLPQFIARSAPAAYRMRAEFRVWHEGEELDYVMFRAGAPRDPVPIEHFPIASHPIQLLMPDLLEKLKVSPTLRRRLFQVEFLNSLSDEMMVSLIYHRKLDDDWSELATALAADLGIHIIGRSRGQKVVIGQDFVDEILEVDNQTYTLRQYEQSFTQPNAGVNQHMIGWARNAADGLGGDLLELYCGNGNFTVPLAAKFDRVLATEVAKTSVRAARHNAEENGVSNIEIVRLSAEEVTEALRGSRQFRRLEGITLSDYTFSTVFVDPPRAGLDTQTEALVAEFENIIYVSCNPDTLCENLKQISKTHEIVQTAAFDQFPYTHHLECGVLLRRR
ncbi:MAG: tRNA (uracil-5-)-methyltransferase [Halieaceae bacterium]|jgi:tRNA (uracil-5-)-methyltransferase